MEPLTDSRSAATTTHLLTACPYGTMIASLSDGGVAHVRVAPLLTRRGRGDAGSKSGTVRRIPSAHVPSCAIPFRREAPTSDPWLTPPHEEGHPQFTRVSCISPMRATFAWGRTAHDV